MDSKSHKIYDLIIIGGGASALMASQFLKGYSFLIIESNEKLGKKLAVCGGGFVNITNKNLSHKNYLGDKAFVETVLNQFDNLDLIRFFENNNIKLELRSDGCYFCKNRSSDLIGFFTSNIPKSKIKLNTKVLDLMKKDNIFDIKTDGRNFKSKKVLIATGAPSYPILGASDIALKLANKFGHNARQFSPALVGFTLQKDEQWMKDLAGVSMPVAIKIDSKTIKQNILFAHKGITGPAVLNSSLWWKKAKITIDFLPNIDIEDLMRSHPNKTPISLFALPKRFIKQFFSAQNLELKAVNRYTQKELDLIRSIKNYSFAPAGTFGLTKAEACKGGILTETINPNSLESKLINGLYFAGEALDVTGEVGGYNLQWAFSTAYLAAKAIRSDEI